jgi:hypothetical protein
MSEVTQKANIAKAQIFSNSLRNSLMANIIGEWKFEEGTGQIAFDSWGGLNNGTLGNTTSVEANDPAWINSGCVIGNCLSFDGGDYVSIANIGNNLGNSVKNISVSLWFKGFNYGRGLIELGGTSGYGILGIAFDYDTSPYNGITLLMGNNELAYVPFSDSLNWHNIVGTYNGVTRYIYLDGLVVAQGSYSSALDFAGKSSVIGGYYNYGAQRFLGSIDDVRIYNIAIPTSQIKEQYYLGLNKLLTSDSITKEEYGQRMLEIAKNLPNSNN